MIDQLLFALSCPIATMALVGLAAWALRYRGAER